MTILPPSPLPLEFRNLFDHNRLPLPNSQVPNPENHYIFSKENLSPQMSQETISETLGLLADDRVLWTQQQFAKHLNKRLDRRAGGAIHDLEEAKLTLNENAKTYRLESNFSKYQGLFNDEWWTMQWYEVTLH